MYSSPPKEVYNPKTFVLHAASLDQGFPHCPKFPTAASRRSRGRVSVPLWPVILLDRLPVFALVGRYPANKLIGRRPLPVRISAFTGKRCRPPAVRDISPPFRGLSP